MRYAYGALVLTSLIWPKDPSGDLGRQTPREGSLRPCRGESKWTQFHNTFCLYPGLCWVCENPWGVHLAGTLVLLFWLLVETWASSRLASLRAKPRETAASLPDPQSEMQRDVDFQIPQPRGSLCICGKRLSSDLESYQPLCERQHGPSSVTYHITGARHQNEVRPDYERSRSLSISRGALRTLSSSPSPSPSSSSSSSSSSSCCLTRLKHLDFPPSSGKFPTTLEDSSSMAYDSSEESESKVSDLCSEPSDPKVLEIKHEFSYISLQPERLPRMRERPECAPEEEKSQPVPSFAQINYTQSSAYEKEDGGIVLVERSFEIHMGEMPPDVGRPDPLTSMFAGQEESQEKPKALALLDQMAHPHVGGTLKLHSFPIVPKTPPQTGHLSICTTSALGDFDPDAFVLDKMDAEILNFLEFHVKKKMVQRQCGVPTVVVRSVQRFQSLEDLRHVEFEREHVRPVKRFMRMPLRAKSPAGLDFQARNAIAIGAKPWQKCPGAKEYYILRPVTPEEIKSLVSGPAMKKPSVKMVLFQGMREKYVLLSMEPDELRRIVFHITVKMLEIKRGTFPEVVERSFRIFGSLSARPLPKTIRWGNKVTRPKHVLLPFVPGEALCLIDLNIQHKYLVHVWRLPTPYSKSEEEMTTAASQPSGPEGHVFKGHKPRDPGVPLFVLKIPKGKKAWPQASESQKVPVFPSPQLAIAGKPPEGRPEKPPEDHTQKLVRFVDIFPAQVLAHEGPPESAIMPREAAAVGTQESIEPGEPGVKRAASSEALPLALSKEGGTTSGEGMEAQKGEDVDGMEDGGKRPREVPEPSSEVGPEPCGEGASSEAGLPAPSRKEAEVAERRDGPAAAKEVLLPPSADATGKGDGERTGAGEAQPPPKETERRSSLRSSKEKGLEGDGSSILGARGPPKPPPRPASCKAALSLDKGGGAEVQKEAEADGMRPRTKEASKRPKEASIVGKASISLKLDMAKEKVNLHLQKKLDAKLRPKQAAHLNLDVEVDKATGGSRRAKKTPHRSHHHRHHHDRHHDPPPAVQTQAQAQAQAKPSRPFCYVCMPLDETGSAVKTVCWALPKRILEMNGHRVPRVARFESKPTGCK